MTSKLFDNMGDRYLSRYVPKIIEEAGENLNDEMWDVCYLLVEELDFDVAYLLARQQDPQLIPEDNLYLAVLEGARNTLYEAAYQEKYGVDPY